MIRTLTYLPAMALAAALASCSPDPDASFAKGRDAYAANNFREARVALISGLREKPDNSQMRLLLARTQIALGDGEGAAATLDKMPRDVADKPEFAVLSGQADVLRGRFEAALAKVEGIEAAPADRVRALAHIGLGEPAKAGEAFATGAARDRPDAALLASYARFKLMAGQTAEAETLVSRALSIDPRHIEAHLVRADARLASNDLPSALAGYERVLQLHPANFDGRVGKAEVLVSQGRTKDAEALIGDLKAESPDDVEVVFLDARLAGRQERWEDVRAILQPREEDVGKNVVVAGLYGRSLVELKQPALALGILEPQLKRHPGSRSLRRLTAQAQLESRDAAAALVTIRPLASRPDATPDELKLAAAAARAAGSDAATGFAKRLELPSPQWVGGELAMADRALRNRQWRDAEAHYETILSRTGGQNAMVLNNLAYAKQQQDKDKEALRLALRAVKLEPDNASILDTAGVMLVRSGSRSRGVEMLQRAAKLDPDNATIARHLGEALKR